ncbi:GTPase family protein, partial [Escherichia coli]
MNPPPPFRCAVLSFFTGNTCMNPSDAIEAIEKPLS